MLEKPVLMTSGIVCVAIAMFRESAKLLLAKPV